MTTGRGCGETGGVTTTVRVGMVAPALPILPLWMAEKTGAFARRGLQVTATTTGSTSGTTEALHAGAVDVAVTSPDAALADGATVAILAGLADRPPLSLVAQPWMTSFVELRGQFVGTTSLREGTVQLVQAIMAANGMHHPDDYGFVLAGAHPQRWEALQSGRLAAALQLMPYDSIAREAGFTVLARAEDHVPAFAFISVLALRGSFGDEAAAFTAALRDGEEAIRTHPGEAARVAAEKAHVAEHLAEESVARLLEGVMPAGLRHSAAALDRTRRAMAELERSDGRAPTLDQIPPLRRPDA